VLYDIFWPDCYFLNQGSRERERERERESYSHISMITQLRTRNNTRFILNNRLFEEMPFKMGDIYGR
jgi:hypothetical protein